MTFKEKLLSGKTVVTLELSPPKGTNVEALLNQARGLVGYVDAINVPDCQLSILKMSSMVAAALIQNEVGLETIWQLTCRDRNLIALQSDLMGGYALGLRNMLALTGDPIQLGDQKDHAKQVFHLDSTRLQELICALNRGEDATGKALKHGGTNFMVGAALNPFRVQKRAQQLRLQQKIENGVTFFQTQPVYSIDPIEPMLAAVSEAAQAVGKPTPRVLVGIIPPKNAQAARYMNQAVVGIEIPESFIELLEKAEDPSAESIRYCADLVESIKPLCNGFHFMPVGMVSKIGTLLEQCFPINQMAEKSV